MLNINRSLLKIALILLFTPISLLAGFGPIGSGGGKGILCTQDEYRVTLYLADTFKYFYEKDNEETNLDESAKTDLPDVSPMGILQGAVSYFEEKYPEKIYPHPDDSNLRISLGEMLILKFNRLKIEFVKDELPNIPDDNIDLEKLPAECRQLIQIAVQDYDKNILKVQSSLFFELQTFEIGFLWLHETLLAIRGQSGDTTPIRKKVASILEDKNFDLYKKILERVKQK